MDKKLREERQKVFVAQGFIHRSFRQLIFSSDLISPKVNLNKI